MAVQNSPGILELVRLIKKAADRELRCYKGGERLYGPAFVYVCRFRETSRRLRKFFEERGRTQNDGMEKARKREESRA